MSRHSPVSAERSEPERAYSEGIEPRPGQWRAWRADRFALEATETIPAAQE